jgi:conjugative transfer region protein TrbK
MRGMFVTTAAAVPVLVVAACTIQLRGNGDSPPWDRRHPGEPIRLASNSNACRKVTSEQVSRTAGVPLIWAENRRRFLGSKTPAVSSVDAQRGRPEHRRQRSPRIPIVFRRAGRPLQRPERE